MSKKPKYMHWREMFDMPYLGHWDLPVDGTDLIKTIKYVEKGEVIGEGGKKDICPIAYMTEGKPMVLSITNCGYLQELTGTANVFEYTNITIALYGKKNVRNPKGGKTTGLRIRTSAPKPKELDTLNPKHPEWDMVLNAVQGGDYTVSKLRKQYKISEANAKLLNGELTPEHHSWAGIRTAIAGKKTTLAEIKKNFSITDENATALCAK